MELTSLRIAQDDLPPGFVEVWSAPWLHPLFWIFVGLVVLAVVLIGVKLALEFARQRAQEREREQRRKTK